ncbi:hypothetical protein FRC10_001201 [Ceratobasidium sp. 414]|nr:hypothetical protein FRC10_001201 [Ceratobasidium sp. 414]
MDIAAMPKLRREPPQPLGSAARYFSVSAATPLMLGADPHPSGVAVRVKLNNTNHPDRPFQTGELVEGHVHIYSPGTGAFSNASRLSLRVYFESRTLFWNLELVSASGKVGKQLQKMKPSTAQDYDTVMRHEVHRGVVPPTAMTLPWSLSAELALDFQPSASARPGAGDLLEAILPFSFVIPRRMDITEYNELERAPRDLCAFEQCPPPTFRDSRDGSVQWVVEAILTLEPGSPFVEDEAMLRQPTDKQVVTRLVFPVLPALEDVGVLRDEPFFGDNPDLDQFGSRRLGEVEQESGKKAIISRVKARGGNWETRVKNIRLSNGKFIASEVYTIAGARVSTSAPNIQLLAYLKLANTHSKSISSFFRSSKPQEIYVQRVLVSLSRSISTRGGKEIRPHTTTFLVRQEDHRLGEQSASTSTAKPGLLIPSDDNADALELDLTFGLQSKEEMDLPGGKRTTTAAKYFIPSFRTPNIQHEVSTFTDIERAHILKSGVLLDYMTLWFSGDDIERYAAQFPIQFVPGDENELPLFEDAVNAAGDLPPAFQANDVQLPQY